MKFDLFSALQSFLEEQQDNLLLWAAVFLGIGSALYFSLSYEPFWGATAAALSGAVVLASATFRKFARDSSSLLSVGGFFISVVILCIFMGFSLAQIRTYFVQSPMVMFETKPVMITAVLDHREDQEGKKGTLLFLKDVAIEKWAGDQTPDQVRLTLKKPTEAQAGDKVQVLAKLTPVSPPVAPGAYDFARHYYFEGIGALGFALSDVRIVEKVPSGFFNLEQIRHSISETIKAMVPEREAGIVSALMTGERAAIHDEDWDALRASGLAHIISISGMHVVMVAAPVFFIVRLLLVLVPAIALRWPVKKIAAGVALLACCLYVGLVVPSVPTTRALLMTGIGLIAIMLDRSPFSLRLVAVSAIAVLVFAPESVWSVSFQMSFAAVTALVAAAEGARPYLTSLYREAGWIKRSVIFIIGTLVTSLIASVATAPYSLFHFQQLASYSVLANAMAVPISGLIIMPMVIVSFLLLPFGFAAESLKLMGIGVSWLLEVARWTENLPGSVLTSSALPQSFVIWMSVAGLSLVLLRGREKALSLVPMCVAILCALMFRLPDALVSDEAKVMAVRRFDHVYISSLRADKFAVETWLKRWNIAEDNVVAFPRQGVLGIARGESLSCDPAACRIEAGGYHLSYGQRAYELKQECLWADVILSDERLPDDFCGQGSRVRIYAHRDFKLNGAVALTFQDEGIEMQSVGQTRGLRPWN